MLHSLLYIWEDTKRPGFLKMGDHTVKGSVSQAVLERETKQYIRAEMKRMKGFYDSGEIIVHKIEDITNFAIRVNRNYEHAKIDDYIAKKSDLRLHRVHGDFYKITLNDMLKYINNVTTGTAKKDNYKAHKFQKEAISTACVYYQSASANIDFLLDCVMRFGKCFTSYQIAKKLNAKKILVITGRPKVKDGWRDDLDHIDFPNWKFIDSQTVGNVKFNDNNSLFEEENPADVEVIFASFQGGKRVDSRLKEVMNQDIDLLIIDEAHAYFSQDAIDFCKNKLKAKKRLWVSGTPFKAYESGMFDGVTDTYRFTLQDLLSEKQRVEKLIDQGIEIADEDRRFIEFPNIQFLVAEYPNLNNDKIYGEEGLNMKTLLSASNGTPNFPDEVNGLLDSLLGTKHRGPFNYSGRNGIKPIDAKHVWMSVPAGKDDTHPLPVAAASTLANSISTHPVLSKKYAPMAIKGDKTQDDVNSHIMLNSIDGLGTINISCRSLNTGTKFPDLDTVVFLSETSSAAEFWQTAGRALQPKKDKKQITIICYSVEMAVTMANKMVEYSVKPGQNHNQVMTEFLNMMPIYVQGGPTVKPLAINEVYQQLSTRGSVKQAFGDREVLSKNFDNLVLNDPQFFNSIPDVNSDKNPNQIVLGTKGLKGKNANIIKQGSTPAHKDLIAEARTKVREFLKCTGSVMAASLLYDQHLVKSSQDLYNINEQTIDGELYVGTKDIITYLLNAGALNTAVLDKKIGAFYNVEIKDKIVE